MNKESRMKRTHAPSRWVALTLTLAICIGFPSAVLADKELETDEQKLSYALGLEIGTFLKGLGTEIDLELFQRAIEDQLKGRKPLISPEEAAQIKSASMRRMQTAKSKSNEAEGEAYLQKNAKKKGVVTTASGLQYEVLKEGNGPKPKATDRVKVHYRGTLVDGTEFDSSYKRGSPATFAANRVIAGWTEALQLMNVGSKYRLVIPPKLAYGERGAGGRIGPNATLIFEVELLGIEK